AIGRKEYTKLRRIFVRIQGAITGASFTMQLLLQRRSWTIKTSKLVYSSTEITLSDERLNGMKYFGFLHFQEFILV
ncbi:MAG: hypothetical protein BECKG1743E_GA0114224_110843, partial [Candidatus Kentron sp. G]